MSHWIVEHAAKVAVGVIVTALIGGIGYISWYASRVPDLETKLSRHDDKLATISANLIFLMNKAGKPLEKKDIKDLLSLIKESGSAKAGLIKTAEVVDGEGELKIVSWVPNAESNYFKIDLKKGMKTSDKATIARLISSATLSSDRTVWSVRKGNILANTSTGEIKLQPVKKINAEELQKWIEELNQTSLASSEVVIMDGGIK